MLLWGCEGRERAVNVSSVVVNPGQTEIIGPGMTLGYEATALDQFGNIIPNVTFEWQTDAPDVAVVSSNGTVTGVAPGNAAITVHAQGVPSNPIAVTVVSSSAVTGTAATGKPLANAAVTLKDSLGRVATAVTAVDGRYTVDTTTLTPPYIVQVRSADGGATLYGVSGDTSSSTTINVTQLTHLIVDSWYRLQGQMTLAAFENPRDYPLPPPLSAGLLGNVYAAALNYWFDRAKVDTELFDPISTPFATDGTGIDYVLDLLTIDDQANRLLLSDGSVSQEAVITFDVEAGILTIMVTILGEKGMSGGTFRTFVPMADEQHASVQAINTQVTELAATIADRDDNLAANDVLPFLSPELLHDGLNAKQYAAALVTAERGKDLSCRLDRIEDLRPAPPRADVIVRCLVSISADEFRAERRRYRFSKPTTEWVISGNQRIASVGVRTELQSFQGAASTGTALKVIASAVAPLGVVTAGSIYGSGMGDGGSVLLQHDARPLEFAPEPGSVITIPRDRFVTASLLENSPLSPLAYDFALTSSDGETLTYTVESDEFTTEVVSISNIAGSTLAEAKLDQPLFVQWTLPETLLVSSVQLQALSFIDESSSSSDCTISSPLLPPESTSATITISSTCKGAAVSRVHLLVIVTGASGARTVTVYAFDLPEDPVSFIPAVMNLPIVRIVTDNYAPIVSKDDYTDGTISIHANGSGEQSYFGTLQIRGRGNSTWTMPKKPYRVKLRTKSALLGMPAHKDWALLANYSDKTLMRNRVAFELGSRFGMAWTPRSRFVELFLNDEYQGTYQLTEQIKVGDNRVDIAELEPEDILGDVLTGGYLLEVDSRLDGDNYFITEFGVPILIDTPDPPEPEQFSYIQDYVQRMEDALYSETFVDPDTGYAAYVDIDSFVNWYLVNEILKNNDAIFFSSCWMYKTREGKLFMGPLWDFDIAAGNVNYNGNDDPTGWYILYAAWINQMFKDPAFVERVKSRWNELKVDEIDSILDYIDQTAAAFRQGALNNFQRWPILDEYVWPNAVVTGSYSGEVEYLREWLETRIAWMDTQFNAF